MISVIIPTYNRAAFLSRSVKSVIEQAYQDVEIIIVDDSSNDNTESVVQTIKNAYPHKIIHYKKLLKNCGAQIARQTGIQMAGGDWITFLDSDDEWLQGRLDKTYDYAIKNGFKIVYCDCFVQKKNGVRIRLNIPKLEGDIYRDLLRKAGPMFQGLLVKKECLDNIGNMDVNIIAHQEWDFSLQIARKYEFGFIDEPLFVWYYDGHDSISMDRKKGVEGFIQIVEKYKDDILKYHGRYCLRKHYMDIAYASYLIKNFKTSSQFYEISGTFAGNFAEKLANKIQSKYVILKYFNPKYLNALRLI